MSFAKALFTDESGKPSMARVGSMVCTAAGILSIIVGFILVAIGVKGVETYVGIVLSATMTKGASDLWAAQIKSAKVAQAAGPKPPEAPPTTTPPPPAVPEKADAL